MTLVTLILALIFAILAVIFATQNPDVVTLSFYGISVEGTLAVVILIALGIGVLIGALILMPGVIKRDIELRSHRKKLGGLEKSLEEQKDKIAKAEHIISIYDPPVEDEDKK
jgi:putative membrane protein